MTLMLCAVGMAGAQPGKAQESTAVRQVVDRLFDGMRAGDSTAVRALFAPEARLLSVVEQEGTVQVHEAPVDRFVEAVGAPHEAVWDEQIRDVEVRVDGPLASVWAPYRFYLGEQFSHCGVNVLALVRREGQWQIRSITDTRRQTDCPFPEAP